MTFGIGTGTTADSVDFAGAMFSAFGADLVDAKGNVVVDSDAVKQVLEYGQKLVKFLPADSVSYDDASNNRALISGTVGADLQSAVGLGGRQARRTEGCRGLLDLLRAEGTQGPLRAVRHVLPRACSSSARTRPPPRN